MLVQEKIASDVTVSAVGVISVAQNSNNSLSERGWRSEEKQHEPHHVDDSYQTSFVIDLHDYKLKRLSLPAIESLKSWISTFNPAADTSVTNARMENLYLLRNESEIEGFLTCHQHLFELVNLIPQVLCHYFPADKLALELLPDFDATGGEQLVVCVITSRPIAEAMAAMKQFDHDGWLRIVQYIGIECTVELEFA